MFIVVCVAACVLGVGTAAAQESKTVEIRKPIVNIYEYLDPKSDIIKQAKQGEFYELVVAGTSWCQVKVKDRVGWVELRACRITNAPPKSFLGIPVGIFALFLVLLVLTLLGVALVVYKQMSSES
jgi:hypothetical protein